jgi:hypothetical protein
VKSPVRVQSETRRQLESSIRALLPSESDLNELAPSKNTTVSAVGVGGIMTGYMWGRFRGRQIRKRKK